VVFVFPHPPTPPLPPGAKKIRIQVEKDTAVQILEKWYVFSLVNVVFGNSFWLAFLFHTEVGGRVIWVCIGGPGSRAFSERGRSRVVTKVLDVVPLRKSNQSSRIFIREFYLLNNMVQIVSPGVFFIRPRVSFGTSPFLTFFMNLVRFPLLFFNVFFVLSALPTHKLWRVNGLTHHNQLALFIYGGPPFKKGVGVRSPFTKDPNT